MGPAAPSAQGGTPINSPSADKLRKRHVGGLADDGNAAGAPLSPTQASFSKGGSDDIEEIIQQLPDWKSQLSLRGYIVGELQ